MRERVHSISACSRTCETRVRHSGLTRETYVFYVLHRCLCAVYVYSICAACVSVYNTPEIAHTSARFRAPFADVVVAVCRREILE